MGDLDRLVARVRHPRAALLPLDPVDLPAAVRARARVPQGRGRQLVSQGRDRARQRAGDRRALRALRHARRGAPARAVVLPHHRLRGSPARRPGVGRVAPAREDDAAQLDRPLRGRGGHVHQSRPGCRLPRVHDAAGHAVRRHLLRHGPRAPGRDAPRGRDRARAGRARVHQRGDGREQRGALGRRAHEDRRAARPHGDQPRQRRADPDVRRRLRADGVRDRGDHGRACARPARLRLRDDVRPADPARRGAGGRRRGRGGAVLRPHRERGARQLGPLHRHVRRRGQGRDHRLARPGRSRPPLDQLPPARLAALPPALLGLPDPDPLLRQLRDGAGPRGPAAGGAPRHRGLRAAGEGAAGRRRGLGEHDVPELRRPRAAGDRHDGHVRRLVVVLPALHRRVQRRGARGIPP